MSYTPPAHNAVNPNFSGSYAPPAHGSVNFAFVPSDVSGTLTTTLANVTASITGQSISGGALMATLANFTMSDGGVETFGGTLATTLGSVMASITAKQSRKRRIVSVICT